MPVDSPGQGGHVVAWVVHVTEGLILKHHSGTPGPRPDDFALLCLGAIGLRRAALSKTVLPALLQCVQGPCDHYMWGKVIDMQTPLSASSPPSL